MGFYRSTSSFFSPPPNFAHCYVLWVKVLNSTLNALYHSYIHVQLLLCFHFSESAVSSGNQSRVKHEFALDYDEIGKDEIQGIQPKLLQVDLQDEDMEMSKPM